MPDGRFSRLDLAVAGLARPPVAGAHEGVEPVPGLSGVVLAHVDASLILGLADVVEEVPAAAVAPPVLVQAKGLDDLLRAAIGAATEQRVVWRDGDSEVLVHLDETRTKTLDGLVLVGVTLESDETGVQEITVPFGVGSASVTAGLLGVTETEPRGHPLLVERWGEAVIATAWKALLDVGQAVAAGAGTDEDGADLVPGAIVAKPEGLEIIPQARHVFEKVVIT